jgi:hypothetical protein
MAGHLVPPASRAARRISPGGVATPDPGRRFAVELDELRSGLTPWTAREGGQVSSTLCFLDMLIDTRGTTCRARPGLPVGCSKKDRFSTGRHLFQDLLAATGAPPDSLAPGRQRGGRIAVAGRPVSCPRDRAVRKLPLQANACCCSRTRAHRSSCARPTSWQLRSRP